MANLSNLDLDNGYRDAAVCTTYDPRVVISVFFGFVAPIAQFT